MMFATRLTNEKARVSKRIVPSWHPSSFANITKRHDSRPKRATARHRPIDLLTPLQSVWKANPSRCLSPRM